MARSKRNKRASKGIPREIPMTDLGWTEDGDNSGAQRTDTHAAGTPGGGAAAGGLAGTTYGDGDPENVEDLDNALGSGIHDTAGEDTAQPPYAGPSGGAVGGSPAEGRVAGGHVRGRLAPGGHRGDSTIGSDPEARVP